ncbi:hypothetical protein [Variovorax guangxiensis]|uniref:hypothetical protein n=1 Tax=Variovorax guangxiensis TaxID=1775474 RepID=UPI0028556EC9|nr:hypothetical protein [Variovorax guangxiensis]MDR6856221.1 hypothetical protein [Variovorax guangxiensis]
MKTLLLAMLLLPWALPCASESSVGTRSATARIGFTVVVAPVFKVLQTTPVAGGHEYRVWANVKSNVLNGKEHRFARVVRRPCSSPRRTMFSLFTGSKRSLSEAS